MGISLGDIVFDIGGGVPKGKTFKAVQTGGPLGGCLPASQLNTPVDFDSLQAAGAVMGSGGMIVVDDDTCMVEFARYFLTFAAAESCGKCVPCRVGGQRLLECLTRITEGQGTRKDLEDHQGSLRPDDVLVAVRPRPANPRADHGRPAVLRRRVHGAHRRQDLPHRPVPQTRPRHAASTPARPASIHPLTWRSLPRDGLTKAWRSIASATHSRCAAAAPVRRSARRNAAAARSISPSPCARSSAYMADHGT